METQIEKKDIIDCYFLDDLYIDHVDGKSYTIVCTLNDIARSERSSFYDDMKIIAKRSTGSHDQLNEWLNEGFKILSNDLTKEDYINYAIKNRKNWK